MSRTTSTIHQTNHSPIRKARSDPTTNVHVFLALMNIKQLAKREGTKVIPATQHTTQ